MDIEKNLEFEQIIKPKKTSNKFTIYKNYQAVLNQTDLTYGIKGHNKFYKIFLL